MKRNFCQSCFRKIIFCPAAFGVAFGILYRALTLITGRRRRKRSAPADFNSAADYESAEETPVSVGLASFQDLLWRGKQFYIKLFSQNLLNSSQSDVRYM